MSPAPRVIGISLISAGQAEGKGKASPFADKRVRQAVNLAVNRQAMVDTFLHGIGKPASQAATEGTFGYNPALKPVAYDPAQAVQMTQLAIKHAASRWWYRRPSPIRPTS